ncbi:MAG: (Fe-S)-binding protein [Promethearchaeota archaeon]
MKLIFLGCLSRSRYKETCKNSINIIKKIDYEYDVLENVPCCGALLYHVASDDELKNHVELVNDWFKENNVTDIVTICAGCYNYLTRVYPDLIQDFNINVKHSLQFLAEDGNLEKLEFKTPQKKIAISYHDPCHLKNAVNSILEEPRKIINSIDNVELKEMENSRKLSICCGAGGGVYSIFKQNAEYNALAVFKQMRRSKALITSCPFCYTAFKAVQTNKENKVRTPVIKFEDFIFKLMNGEDLLK